MADAREPMSDHETPLACEYCNHTPATQVFSADVFKLGRHTSFCCPSCGDEQEFYVRRLDGKSPVWRYTITPIVPIKENAGV